MVENEQQNQHNSGYIAEAIHHLALGEYPTVATAAA